MDSIASLAVLIGVVSFASAWVACGRQFGYVGLRLRSRSRRWRKVADEFDWLANTVVRQVPIVSVNLAGLWEDAWHEDPRFRDYAASENAEPKNIQCRVGEAAFDRMQGG